MSEGMKTGVTYTLPGLAGRLHVSFESLEQIIDRLVKAGLVRKLAANGWVMVRDAEHINVSELYALFVFESPRLHAADEDVALLAWLESVASALTVQTNISLKALFARLPAEGAQP